MIDIDEVGAEGVATSAMKAKLIELEAEKEALSAKMAAFPQANNVVVLHLAAVDAYRKKAAELQAALTADEQKRHRHRARQARGVDPLHGTQARNCKVRPLIPLRH